MIKTTLLSVLLSIGMFVSFAQDKAVEEEAIKKVIVDGYVNALLNFGDTEPTRSSFYPGFFITKIEDNQISHYPIYNWIENVEGRKQRGEIPTGKFEPKFPLIDITANAAIVKMELYKNGELIFTDYLSLYRFTQGWKIVQKIYHRHPQKQ